MMTHTYTISGMTCSHCKNKVQDLLSKVTGVKAARVDLEMKEAVIEMTDHVNTETLKAALKDYPNYQLTEANLPKQVLLNEKPEEKKSWFETYKPIVLLFIYITIASLIAGISAGTLNVLQAMRIFMAGFFISFSFFKMLDLRGFADSYSMYDIIAKKYYHWGYIYAFIELALGIGYVANILPGILNYFTLAVMSVSITGVLQSVFNKRKISCACLGAIFNLPMSTVTIFEDALMIAMSVIMIIMMQ